MKNRMFAVASGTVAVAAKPLTVICILCVCALVAPLRLQAADPTSTPAAADQIQRVVARLKELNPGYDGKETHKIAGGKVTALAFSTETVSDISPLSALADLQTLDCSAPWWTRKGKLTDLSALKSLPLHKLNCADNPQIADLSPLKDMPLAELNICSTAVSDLQPLKGMKLTTLRACAAKVADLTPLKGMPISTLDLAHTPVTDLAPLKDMPISWLDINGTNVTDLAPLHGMPMAMLRLPATKIADLSPLKGMPLTSLSFFNTTLNDVSPLKDLPLKTIYIKLVPARDAAVLRSIKTLEKINNIPVAEFWKKPENQAP